MIEGVELIPLVTHNDERGFFREILKSSQLPKFGQWSMSYMFHGVIKAFHIHEKQWDYWQVVEGVIKAVLVDLRLSDYTMEDWQALRHYPVKEDRRNEFILTGEQVLVIPPGVAHGLKVLQGPAVLMYITSEEYNPQDEGRIPYDGLGYDWFKQEIK